MRWNCWCAIRYVATCRAGKSADNLPRERTFSDIEWLKAENAFHNPTKYPTVERLQAYYDKEIPGFTYWRANRGGASDRENGRPRRGTHRAIKELGASLHERRSVRWRFRGLRQRDRVISDKMVTNRRGGKCHACGGTEAKTRKPSSGRNHDGGFALSLVSTVLPAP